MTSPVTRAVSASGRIEFLSRYKGFLAVLVVLIHTGISYGAGGGWLFTEQHDVLWLKVLATASVPSRSPSFWEPSSSSPPASFPAPSRRGARRASSPTGC